MLNLGDMRTNKSPTDTLKDIETTHNSGDGGDRNMQDRFDESERDERLATMTPEEKVSFDLEFAELNWGRQPAHVLDMAIRRVRQALHQRPSILSPEQRRQLWSNE